MKTMNLTNPFFYLAPIIGIVALIIGILAVLQPQKMSEKFGIAVTGSALPYVISTGVRDIFIGLTILILFSFKNWSVLGYIHFCIGVVAISDSTVVLKYGNKKVAMVHVFGAILAVAYGLFLI